MNFANLKSMTREQLMEVAGKTGVKVHWKAKPETIIKHIMETALNQQMQPIDQFKGEDMRPKALKAKTAEYNYTEEDVREACADYLKKEGFEAKFPGDDTVVVRYKGAEDSLNLKQPMSVIKRKIAAVAQGRIALRSLNHILGDMPVGRNSAYTNTVIG